jgi:hypothetical protein
MRWLLNVSAGGKDRTMAALSTAGTVLSLSFETVDYNAR